MRSFPQVFLFRDLGLQRIRMFVSARVVLWMVHAFNMLSVFHLMLLTPDCLERMNFTIVVVNGHVYVFLNWWCFLCLMFDVLALSDWFRIGQSSMWLYLLKLSDLFDLFMCTVKIQTKNLQTKTHAENTNIIPNTCNN